MVNVILVLNVDVVFINRKSVVYGFIYLWNGCFFWKFGIFGMFLLFVSIVVRNIVVVVILCFIYLFIWVWWRGDLCFSL